MEHEKRKDKMKKKQKGGGRDEEIEKEKQEKLGCIFRSRHDLSRLLHSFLNGVV